MQTVGNYAFLLAKKNTWVTESFCHGTVRYVRLPHLWPLVDMRQFHLKYYVSNGFAIAQVLWDP